jgi:hypothetical protein
VVGRDGALVDEEELELLPGHAVEEWVRGSASRAKVALGVDPPETAMRTRPRAATASSDEFDEMQGGAPGEGGWVGLDDVGEL